uniref:Uncharacterized protein n=1 Tax=Arundo donax TaxID=35708 RepID=A0A0A9E3K6_ARUDO
MSHVYADTFPARCSADCSNAIRFSTSATVRNSIHSCGSHSRSLCSSFTASGTGPSTDAMPATAARLLEPHPYPLQVARRRQVLSPIVRAPPPLLGRELAQASGDWSAHG